MVCSGAAVLSLAGIEFGCTAPVALAVPAAAALAIAGAVLTALQVRRFRAARRLRHALPALALLAGFALAAALAGPWVSRAADGTGRHVAVAVDLSDSMRRDGAALGEALGEARRRLSALDAGPDETASIVVFGGAATRARDGLALANLSAALPGAAAALPRATGRSDLAAGIGEAVAAVLASGRPGSVILLSDGLATAGDTLAAAEAAGRHGIPVHVLPMSSPAPGMGIVSARLPPQVPVGTDTVLRAVLAAPADRPAAFSVEARVNGDEPSVLDRRTLATGQWAALRVPVRFAGRGLQFVELRVSTPDGGPDQVRRVFTQVVSPVRLAALGPAPWLSGLPADRYAIDRPAPDRPFDPTAFDVVVIDGIKADRLAPGQVERLAQAVHGAATGLLLVNGPHPGSDEAPTVLMSYEGSALDPLLPVSSQPRLERQALPARRIVILIDTSGSMAGPRLEHAKALALHIVEQLNERDTATITAFASGYEDVLAPRRMDAGGKAGARAAIDGLQAGGGTDPNAALQRLASSGETKCGLFFISDGEFSLSARQAGCMTTVFAIDQTSSSVNPDIYQLGEVHLIGLSGSPQPVKLGFFDPEPRKKTFERGDFVPDLLGPDGLMPAGHSVSGTAVSYPRSGADLISTRPFPIDPVLAFGDAGRGTVGVFTTAVPAHWAGSQGRAAIEAWIERLAAQPDPDRYLVDVQDDGAALDLRLTLATPENDALPRIDRVAAGFALRGEDGMRPLRLDADARVWGRHRARITLPADGPYDGFLELRETGPDALARPQRLGLRLPAAATASPGSADEHWTHGSDETLLRTVAAVSGGVFDPPAGFLRARPAQPPRHRSELWPVFAVLAAAAYLALVALWRLRA